MNEVWKPIPKAEGYEVSDLGRVRSPRGLLRPHLRPSGHTVTWVKGYGLRYTHFFVLLAFIGPRPNGLVSLHMNHCPADNRIGNLRYGTISENIRMDIAAGKRLHVSRGGDGHAAVKLSDRTVEFIKSSSLDAKDIAEIFCVTPHHVRAIRRGVTRCSSEQQPSQLKEKTMAKKTLSPAEIKAAKKDLTAALKTSQAGLKPYLVDVKNAEKALGAAKKEADKAVADAQKTVDAAKKKLDKATAAAAKGEAKIKAQLEALEPAEA